MKQLKEDFLLAVRLVYKKILFVFIYTILVAVLSPESPKFVETVSNVTLAGVVLYLIVFYACIAMLFAAYFYPVIKEKIGESQSFVKRFAFIVGIQTVLFFIENLLYGCVADSLLHSPRQHYNIVFDGNGIGMVTESIGTVAMALTVVMIILIGRRIMTGLAAMSRK